MSAVYPSAPGRFVSMAEVQDGGGGGVGVRCDSSEKDKAIIGQKKGLLVWRAYAGSVFYQEKEIAHKRFL